MPKTAQRSFSTTPLQRAAQPTQPARLSGMQVAATTLGAITLVLGATAGFLWVERERVLAEASELTARGAHRLATDLQQSLTVAHTAMDQFNERRQLASSQSL